MSARKARLWQRAVAAAAAAESKLLEAAALVQAAEDGHGRKRRDDDLSCEIERVRHEAAKVLEQIKEKERWQR